MLWYDSLYKRVRIPSHFATATYFEARLFYGDLILFFSPQSIYTSSIVAPVPFFLQHDVYRLGRLSVHEEVRDRQGLQGQVAQRL